MLLVAGVHLVATPSPEERGWVEVPDELRDADAAIPPAPAGPAPSTTLGEAAPAPDGAAASTLADAAPAPDVAGSATASAPPSYDPEREADCPENEPEPPLFAAIRAGDLGRVRSLLAGDRVSANLHCDYGEGTGAYPLELALLESKLAIAEALLDAGADPSLAGQGSAPPLQLAASAGSERLVRRLLAAGADPDTAHGDVPVLYEAAGTVYVGIVRALLDAGANANAAYLGNAAIHHAAEGNAPEVVRALVAGGADLDAGNRFGLPPAAVAARAGKAELALILLEAGGRDATWAVRGALDGGHLDLARALAARGVNVENHIEGCSVLTLAAEKGDVPLLRAILAGNARVQEHCLREALEAARRGPENGEPVVRLLSALR
jgi:ankyrin repeat protein